jgi:acetylornithine deacetylase/succinyl-diaminopimelate desuccinylase-like protein
LPFLKEKLKSDYLVIVDFDAFDTETPAISLGARGLVAFEMILKGSDSDLHSGVHGGLAYNPNRAIAELISKMYDGYGRVAIEGFYEGVVHLSEKELKEFDYKYSRKEYEKTFGVHALSCPEGLSLMEANCFLPTLEVNGMSGGYTGEGFKTVIPKEARAKISCRLVQNQDPKKIFHAIEKFLKTHLPNGMQLRVELLSHEKAFRGSPHSEVAKALEKALEEVTKKKCKRLLSGGSIPVVAKMVEALNVEVVGMGYGLATDLIHAPNEHFDIKRFEKGFLSFARMLENL